MARATEFEMAWNLCGCTQITNHEGLVRRRRGEYTNVLSEKITSRGKQKWLMFLLRLTLEFYAIGSR